MQRTILVGNDNLMPERESVSEINSHTWIDMSMLTGMFNDSQVLQEMGQASRTDLEIVSSMVQNCVIFSISKCSIWSLRVSLNVAISRSDCTNCDKMGPGRQNKQQAGRYGTIPLPHHNAPPHQLTSASWKLPRSFWRLPGSQKLLAASEPQSRSTVGTDKP